MCGGHGRMCKVPCVCCIVWSVSCCIVWVWTSMKLNAYGMVQHAGPPKSPNNIIVRRDVTTSLNAPCELGSTFFFVDVMRLSDIHNIWLRYPSHTSTKICSTETGYECCRERCRNNLGWQGSCCVFYVCVCVCVENGIKQERTKHIRNHTLTTR